MINNDFVKTIIMYEVLKEIDPLKNIMLGDIMILKEGKDEILFSTYIKMKKENILFLEKILGKLFNKVTFISSPDEYGDVEVNIKDTYPWKNNLVKAFVLTRVY